MTTDTSFDAMTPAQLRQEADRRELVERHRLLMERIAARQVLAGELLTLSDSTVNAASARSLLVSVLNSLLQSNADDLESLPTNGQISLASHGLSHTWWSEVTADHAHRDPDSPLERHARRQLHPWGGD